MPAAPSSPIDPAIGQLLAAVQSVGCDRATVLPVLAAVADPRARRGIRHRLDTILAVAVCAVLAGARSFVAIAEWAADADDQTREQLGIVGAMPCESTVRRTLQRLDADAFDDRLGAWAQHRTTPRPDRRRLIAVDGKTLRGSRESSGSGGASSPGRHLLAALDHAHGVVLGQVDVAQAGEAKTNEIPMFTKLLDRIELAGAVVTADAMHAQRDHATYLVGQRRAHYLLTVKRNQPSLHAQLAALPWRDIPLAHDSRDRGHGRAERRTPESHRRGRRTAVPARCPGRSDRPPPQTPRCQEVVHPDRVRHHLADPGPGQPGLPCRDTPRPLDHRSGSPGALRRRGPLRTGRAGFPRTSAQASPPASRVTVTPDSCVLGPEGCDGRRCARGVFGSRPTRGLARGG